ncbi:MAG TPA: PAS domain S-box protein [Candidatus Eisenbacteria bacterium]|nr:PAS domain S-box protein [Candidatus Eisenbacteria bacterium]
MSFPPEDPLARRPSWFRYLAAASLVALALVIRWPLEPFLQSVAPYAFFYLPILICAWYWGVGPAVFASVLSGAVTLAYLWSRNEPLALPSLLPFAVACTGMVFLARAARGQRNEQERVNGYLAAIIHSSNDAIVAKDLNGFIRSCNPACEKMFGYTQSELLGKSVTMLIPPELHYQEEEILARMRKGETIEHFDTVRVTKDGRRIDVSLTISPVRAPNGQIIGISKTARDVTEVRRAERALAAQQEWFRVTLASIGDAVIATNPDGRITFLNGPAERLTGWSKALAQGKPLSEVFHIINEQTRKPVPDPVALVMRRGTVVGMANHTVLVSRDGAEYPIADSAAPIRDESGAILGVVLVFSDMTEERRAEEALADERERFERTLESIGDGVIATDVHCHIQFMNPVAEHLTGWSVKDAVGRDCEEVFHVLNERTRQPVENPVKQVLDNGVIVGLANHTVLISRGGKEWPIDDSAAPIRNREGRIVGAVLVFRDVTERRRADQERHQTATERERLLESERLARAEAERATRVKDDFMAMVSHELRTPLNAIVGWTQLLLAAPSDPAATQRGLEVIGRNARVQAQLISDLLDVSRIVSGKLLLEVQSVDLVDVIEAAMETVAQMAKEKGVELHAELDRAPGAGLSVGDPARLQQVVWNLLSNAIKFTPGGGRIDVEMKHVEQSVEIKIRDTGVGIKPELRGRIFDRFYQQDGPTTRRHGGLGLGLSIVRHLVELHGGTVSAWSEGEGQGATFSIVLPHSAPGIRSDTSQDSSGTLPLEEQRLKNVQVLIVEDEPDTRDLLRRMLETHGALVTTAGHASEALEAVNQKPPDILLSDIGLPGTDGYELIRRVRKSESDTVRATPAIALTAFARSEERTRALQAGYHVHIAKPVEPAELIATVASLVGLRRGSRAGA